MIPLPVIVGFGGYNAAGRSSHHQSYLRTILETLPSKSQAEVLIGLGTIMGELSFNYGVYRNKMGSPVDAHSLGTALKQYICANTLVRQIPPSMFDVNKVKHHIRAGLSPIDGATEFIIDKKKLPVPLPFYWECQPIDDDRVRVKLSQVLNALLPSQYALPVQSAGALPTGFDPSNFYNARFHPRGLQMALLGASDAVNMSGLDWDLLKRTLPADSVAVYASSIMSQLDEHSFAGLLQGRLLDKRVSTKQLALGLNSMPADFINAYVLGNLGVTGSMTGACASFLYNLRLGVEDIQSGRRQLVVVGCSEAPITPEIIEGYATMGALASDDKLAKLDGLYTPNYQRASRPFGENCGFTIAESSQYAVLMSDDLALSTGATVYGAVPDVFVHSDGPKKSISAPGPGNYISMARAVASAQSIVGKDKVARHSFVQAHGSSTPQNRITESAIFDKVAKAFDISEWPVTAIKSYLGHSLGPASGDQLASTLGVFEHGYLPGIKTIDKVASDVNSDRLSIALSDTELHKPALAFLNSKGFGGNNATATILSPTVALSMIAKRSGSGAMRDYYTKNEIINEASYRYHRQAQQGNLNVCYHFGEDLVEDETINISDEAIDIEGRASIDLTQPSPYEDMI